MPAADVSSANAFNASGRGGVLRGSRSAATDRRTSASASTAWPLRLRQHGVGPFGIGGEHRAGGLHLHLDDREVVAEPIVDLAGQPVALLCRRELLGLRGVVPQHRVRRGQLGARPLLALDERRHDQREHRRAQHAEPVAQPRGQRHARVHERHHGGHRDRGGQRQRHHALADQHEQQQRRADTRAGQPEHDVAEQQLEEHVG